ncbi:signal peptide peptidase SppA [Flammeovirga agarivorans]|uniref:Signal peptide peptidase SppA n=1 Tax=Flammeovirga agarivorans TaxID=2726742 RepID=A0A7X8SLC3_9BACT|nr:signal peptide peptidase SppA [Flammeovirga agarivorans]NLR92370.1 signal peptide peptidase SppA [Flammeovirga agarivorans]
MKGFIKTTFAVIVGIFLSSFLLSMLGAFIVGAIVSSSNSSEPAQIDAQSILVLDITKPIREIGETDPFESLNSSFFPSNGARGLHDVLDIIDKATNDENIAGIYLKGGSFGGSLPMAVEIREALSKFKASDKFVYSYADGISETGYYVISEASRVYLNPIGNLELNGFSSEIMYFKDFFEKIGIKPEVFRVGKYKSAVEPFITDKMSDANREQISSYLNGLYDHYLVGVSASRGIDLETLRSISAEMKVRNAEDAVKFKLVDQLAYVDEVKEDIAKMLEIEETSDLSFINYSKYKDALDPRSRRKGEGKVVVLSAEGEIKYGKADGSENVITNKDLVPELNKLAEDDDVSAVVLRVNSPGGSALSSDLIWRAVQNLKKKKPVVASMSTYAASGGYYISMGCDKIVAYPNTITGSIGIFGLAFNPSDLMTKKLGLKTYTVSTGKFSNYQSLLDDFSKEDRAIIQQNVNEGYEVFTSKAAEGRNMSLDALLKVAQGRVWTGSQAYEVKLVDELGGYQKAIEVAAELAGLEEDNYKIKYLPGEKDMLQELLSSLETGSEAKIKEMVLGEYSSYVDGTMSWLESLKGVQARQPYYEVIEGFEMP